jgi:multicomponent Na+:H+ antiporter subunit D
VLSLVGVPPFSGFIAKLALTEAGFSSHEFAIVGLSLLVSLLTLLAMFRIWMGVFWNPAEEPSTEPTATSTSRLGGPPLMVIPAALLVVCSLAIAVAAGPLFALSQRTADDLLHPNRYVHEVLAK